MFYTQLLVKMGNIYFIQSYAELKAKDFYCYITMVGIDINGVRIISTPIIILNSFTHSSAPDHLTRFQYIQIHKFPFLADSSSIQSVLTGFSVYLLHVCPSGSCSHNFPTYLIWLGWWWFLLYIPGIIRYIDFATFLVSCQIPLRNTTQFLNCLWNVTLF